MIVHKLWIYDKCQMSSGLYGPIFSVYSQQRENQIAIAIIRKFRESIESFNFLVLSKSNHCTPYSLINAQLQLL